MISHNNVGTTYQSLQKTWEHFMSSFAYPAEDKVNITIPCGV